MCFTYHWMCSCPQALFDTHQKVIFFNLNHFVFVFLVIQLCFTEQLLVSREESVDIDILALEQCNAAKISCWVYAWVEMNQAGLTEIGGALLCTWQRDSDTCMMYKIIRIH